MSDALFEPKSVEKPVEPVEKPATKSKGKHSKPMSEERKAALKLQLVKARAASLAKRQQKAKTKKLNNTKIKEVENALENLIPEEQSEEDEEDEEVIIVKKERKKVTRVVEETELEMESRIEKRIREKLEKERLKELKEQERTKEILSLRQENEMLKSRSHQTEVKSVVTKSAPSAPISIPENKKVDYSQFSTFGNANKYKW